ncbi:MAG TPA: hypothetical protein VEP67_13295 [Thiobacillaceae bacterium]|nr:hypothetical protein [Thiobacillaceae bacterium]
MKWLAVIAVVWAGQVHAGWQFLSPVDVFEARPGVFPHLDAANRQGVAGSGGWVAVAWEDNRSGTSQCYARFKGQGESGFGREIRLSSKPCIEPVIVGLGGGRFAAGWEEDGTVWVALVQPGKFVAPRQLSSSESAQITLAYDPQGGLFAAWVARSGDHLQLRVGRLEVTGNEIRLTHSGPVEMQPPIEDQAYPALAVNADGSVVVVWEDRRFKHTLMLVAHSQDGEHFGAPYRLIDSNRSLSAGPGAKLGAGMGAMRPTLARCGTGPVPNPGDPAATGSCLVAVWLDKRDFLSGYDVYAALSANGGRSFGHNLKVQDSFGDSIAQWHAAVAANRHGRVVAMWDDDRDGSSDIWLATWTGKGFSDNVAVPGASGPGSQTDPMLYLDDAGRLHLTWLDQAEQAADTRIRYVSAVWRD